MLRQRVTSPIGQEFMAGQIAGFEASSAVSMVKAGIALPFVTEENVDLWGKAFARADVQPPDIEQCAGPLVTHLRARMAEIAALEAQALAEQQSMEENAAKRKAQQDAEEAEAARLAALQTPAIDQVPVKSTDTMSNADVAAEDAHDPEPAAKPTPPAPTTKRGSKTPR